MYREKDYNRKQNQKGGVYGGSEPKAAPRRPKVTKSESVFDDMPAGGKRRAVRAIPREEQRMDYGDYGDYDDGLYMEDSIFRKKKGTKSSKPRKEPKPRREKRRVNKVVLAVIGVILLVFGAF